MEQLRCTRRPCLEDFLSLRGDKGERVSSKSSADIVQQISKLWIVHSSHVIKPIGIETWSYYFVVTSTLRNMLGRVV